MNARDRIIEQRMAKRRRNVLIMKSIIAAVILLIIGMSIVLIKAGILNVAFDTATKQTNHLLGKKGSGGAASAEKESEEKETQAAVSSEERIAQLRAQAEAYAAVYDYQSAISLLKNSPEFAENTEIQNAVSAYQTAWDESVAYPVDEVTHIFFHSLIRDTAKAFDGDAKEGGYNQVMTTIKEFNSIIQQMYDKGYVMVSMHDMCTIHEDGTVTRGEIRLPPGKIPFVLSQDDVSYYHYMDGDGFPNKLIVDTDGRIRNTYIEDDGSISIGDYDMVPLIDRFVEQHPDFSYHGHKGIVALTGYEGVLGYRTDEVYKTREAGRVTDFQRVFFEQNPDFDYEKEVAEAKKVADAMKAEGWEFASHTWGHINPLGYGYDSTVRDTNRWLNYVAPVVGSTDVLIFAFGADIGDWHPYTRDNQFFAFLKDNGFSIFCNVDGSAKHWVQFGDDYMRQARRNLDGYRMYYNPDFCEDLFDVQEAWDSARPTPVPPI